MRGSGTLVDSRRAVKQAAWRLAEELDEQMAASINCEGLRFKVPGSRARTAAKLFHGEKFGSNAVVPCRLARHSATRDGGFPPSDR